LDLIWEYGRTRHDKEVLGMMGYARRDYGLIGMATEQLTQAGAVTVKTRRLRRFTGVFGTCPWRQAVAAHGFIL
jgi:hypothetical protein